MEGIIILHLHALVKVSRLARDVVQRDRILPLTNLLHDLMLDLLRILWVVRQHLEELRRLQHVKSSLSQAASHHI
jgi:hypothetical protein